MSSATQTLNEVSRLLDALPGIEVLDRRVDGHSAIFEITSHAIASAYLVQCLCEAANVALDPSVHEPGFSAEAARHFSLSAGTDGFDSIEFGNLQLLGIHLVWHLHRVGEMPTETANLALQRWNGARAGA